MCGRYTFFTDRELRELDEIIDQINDDVRRDEMKAGEIFPNNIVPVLITNDNSAVARLFRWGFPSFQGKRVIINSRSETVHEKRMFRSLIGSKRCVIPSTGFYEWDSEKKKFLFNLAGSSVLYMAGLYNYFDDEPRFVILTTTANDSVSDVHDRMPLALHKDKVEDWLFKSEKSAEILLTVPPALVRVSA